VSGASLPEPPRLLAAADLERLHPDERELYDCARQDYHSELTLVATPDILKITRAGQRLVTSNRGKQLGRKGLMVSGPSGTGKSTSITQLGKIHQVDVERRAPRGAGRIPVACIIVPPDATPKNVAIEIAAFLGLPYSSHENPHFITHSVASVLRKVGCSMVLVDEVHRLDLRTRKGAAASDELKYLFDSVSATFVYAGLDLAENGMFTGTRGRQLASRFIALDTTAFGYATDKEKADWRMLVATLEDAAYLHQRTGGMIGSLDQLIHDAANEAIADGTEKVTREHLAAITLDTAAEQQYRPHPALLPARPPRREGGPGHEGLAPARPPAARDRPADRRGDHPLLRLPPRRRQRPARHHDAARTGRLQRQGQWSEPADRIRGPAQRARRRPPRGIHRQAQGPPRPRPARPAGCLSGQAAATGPASPLLPRRAHPARLPPLPAGRIRPVRPRRPDPARLDAPRLPPPPALARP
jgi:hypothetical protein